MDQQYQYQILYLEQLHSPLSTLSLCQGIVRPQLNPPLCSEFVLSIGTVDMEGAVDLDHSQGQSGFYSGLSYALLTVTGSTNVVWQGAEANSETFTLYNAVSCWPESGLCPCGYKFFVHTQHADGYESENVIVLKKTLWTHFKQKCGSSFLALFHYLFLTLFPLSCSPSFIPFTPSLSLTLHLMPFLCVYLCRSIDRVM